MEIVPGRHVELWRLLDRDTQKPWGIEAMGFMVEWANRMEAEIRQTGNQVEAVAWTTLAQCRLKPTERQLFWAAARLHVYWLYGSRLLRWYNGPANESATRAREWSLYRIAGPEHPYEHAMAGR